MNWLAIIGGIGGVVIAIVVAFVGGSAAGSIISAYSQSLSDRYTDLARLRDQRAERLRETFKTLLRIAGTQSDMAREMSAIFQMGNVDERRTRIQEAIDTATNGYAEARIALRLEPKMFKEIDPLFDATQRAYIGFTLELDIRGRTPGRRSWELLEEEAKNVYSAVDTFHTAMVRILDELEQPIPPIPPRPWWFFLWGRQSPPSSGRRDALQR